MKQLLKNIAIAAASLLVLAGVQVAVASTIPNTPAVFETYLAGQQLSTDTTLSLASVTLRDGTTLSGYTCLTIDSNTSSLEYECGTLSGTSMSGITRGIDAVTGTTSISALQFTHRRGADVKVTDYPILTQLSRIVNGIDTLPVPVTYFSHPCNVGSASTTVCDKNYIDSQVVAGAAAGNTATAGIFLTSTAVQTASSTVNGVFNSITYLRVVPTSLATSSPTPSICGVGCVPATRNDGKISPQFIATTSADTYNFGGSVSAASSTIYTINVGTVNATSSINLNGVPLTPKFGGTGALGALNISSGTTTINLNNQSFVELDYTSVSITATGNLAFSNPNTNGTFIEIRSQGAVTITCTNGTCIDIHNTGSTGNGNAFYLFGTNAGATAGSGNSPGSGGATPTAIAPAAIASSSLLEYGGQFWVGSAGGAGNCNINGGSCGTAGTGGQGAGGLLIESAGALNFTGGIYAIGNAGGNASGGSSGCTSGGGGGSGGFFKAIYNVLTSISGTVTTTGGVGGKNSSACVNVAAGGGGGGGTAYTAGSGGGSSSAASAVTGGAGANGYSVFELNTVLN